MSAGVILVDRHGRILLQLRDSDPAIMYPDHWGITGGAGNAGETPEEIARREVLEETGITLGRISPFRAYYFEEARQGSRRRKSGSGAMYELYLYHAPCEVAAEDMHCGEGRALRFFAPHELPTIDIAYNHRDVLEDFLSSPHYPAYVRGAPFSADAGEEQIDPVQHFRGAVAVGEPWFDALMAAIALWERPVEDVDGRRYRYLVGGEAFDWLLLAERILEEVGDRVPEREAEALLFEGRPPDADGGALRDERLRELLGASKHRAHLNYVYGVTVEEALQYAVELDVAKERATVSLEDGRATDAPRDPVFERIYGRRHAELLAEFREAAGLSHEGVISLAELREFQYWLFQYRVRTSEPARVASDTRKALAQLSAMEAAVRRSRRRGGSAVVDASLAEELLQEVH